MRIKKKRQDGRKVTDRRVESESAESAPVAESHMRGLEVSVEEKRDLLKRRLSIFCRTLNCKNNSTVPINKEPMDLLIVYFLKC